MFELSLNPSTLGNPSVVANQPPFSVRQSVPHPFPRGAESSEFDLPVILLNV